MRKSTIIALLIVLLSFFIGIYFYPQMPESMVSHWNASGEADGYMPKFWGLFLMPIITLALLLFLLVIPRIDPLKANIAEFRSYYDGFVVLMTGYLLYVYLLTIVWNLGILFDMLRFLIPAFALLFYYMGVMLEHAKRNWFIGIRTPWTLSNDEVWRKTHELGGRLFKVAGILVLLGLILPQYALFFMIVPVLGVAVYTIAYSYFEYQKLNSH